MTPTNQRDLVDLLITLRREGRQQSGLEARLVPPDPATAYRIAAMVGAELGWPVVGWKIAAFKAEMQRELRTDAPIYGPVYGPGILSSPATVSHARQLSPIPEAEYQIVLGAHLPPRDRPYSEAEVTEAIAAIHPGLELAECRFVHDDHFPPLPAILADGAGSGTIVLGPAIEDWQARDIPGQQVTLACNGEVRRSGTADAALDHPVAPLTWLANELSRTGTGLKAGQVVSTGTLTGMIRPRQGETYTADFGPLGSATATYA